MDHLKCQKLIPCISSITGLLSVMVKPGKKLTAKQVMFTVLSVKDTVSLSVDMRIFSVPFTVMVDVMTTIPSSICCSLASQVKLLPTAVQVNSATPLIETLTDRGGTVISAIQYQELAQKQQIKCYNYYTAYFS